jgi:hypothetical protein
LAENVIGKALLEEINSYLCVFLNWASAMSSRFQSVLFTLLVQRHKLLDRWSFWWFSGVRPFRPRDAIDLEVERESAPREKGVCSVVSNPRGCALSWSDAPNMSRASGFIIGPAMRRASGSTWLKRLGYSALDDRWLGVYVAKSIW